MSKPFFTKKQKAQMRARRKKMKQHGIENPKISKKRPRSDDDIDGGDKVMNEELMTKSNDTTANNNDKKQQQQQQANSKSSSLSNEKLKLITKVRSDILEIMIPSNITTPKDLKKFRKEARRQLRQENKHVEFLEEDNAIHFIPQSEFSMPQKKKLKKASYPSIQNLLQQKEEQKEQQKLKAQQQKERQTVSPEIKSKYVALDCEMVGIGTEGKISVLARASLVDWDGNILLDTFVQVPTHVTDFRTHVSGVEAKHINHQSAMDPAKCREKVAEILKNKILVGHALSNDLKVLFLNHPKQDIRDTSKYRPFQRYLAKKNKWRPRKLRDLVQENVVGLKTFQQQGPHDSVQDAYATMQLFQTVYVQWEKEMAKKQARLNRKKK